MMDRFQQFAQVFEARTMRERLLIAATGMALLWGLWLVAIGGALMDEQAEVVRNINQVEAALQEQNLERTQLLSREQPVALQQQKVKLQQTLAVHEAELAEVLNNFVSPQEMPALLESLLDAQSNLKLVRLTSKAPELLVEADIPIYRHPVVLEFQGRYLDVLRYLEAVEASDWQVSWRRIELGVVEHPTVQVEIELETLSDSEELLGV